MSLTRHLESPQSPVHQFLAQHFSNLGPILQDAQRALAGKPTLQPPAAAGYPYALIGTAFDYRLRYYFAATPSQWFVAWSGLRRVVAAATVLDDALDQLDWAARVGRTDDAGAFFPSLDGEATRLQPPARRLSPEEEVVVARYCLVLALFEDIYRSGGRVPRAISAAGYPATAPELLALAQPPWVDDLCALSWAFYGHHAALCVRPAILNPDFAGSRDVGGADADLVVDGCLLEIKTTTRPAVELGKGAWLRQLLGYVLLDYPDQHRINAIGLYLSLQHELLRWPLAPLLARVTGDAAPLAEWRERFHRITSTLRP